MEKTYIIQLTDAYGSVKFINPKYIALIETFNVTITIGTSEVRWIIHIMGAPKTITLDKEGWENLMKTGIDVNFTG